MGLKKRPWKLQNCDMHITRQAGPFTMQILQTIIEVNQIGGFFYFASPEWMG